MGQQEKNEHPSRPPGEIAARPKRKTRKAAKQGNQLHEIQRMAKTIFDQATRRIGQQEDRKVK